MEVRRMMVVGVMVVLAVGVGVLAQETDKAKEEAKKKELSKAEVEKIITDGILEFWKDMTSEDEETRIKAFDRVVPDKELVVKLFGEKDAEVLWPQIETGHPNPLAQLRKQTHLIREELLSKGEVKGVELVNVREDDGSRRYAEVLQMIPKDVPVYHAAIPCQKMVGILNGCLVADGKFRWFDGLKMAPRVLRKKKGQE